MPKLPSYHDLGLPSYLTDLFNLDNINDKFNQLIGGPIKDLLGLDPDSSWCSIGGGGINDLLQFNPAATSMPNFSSSCANQPLTLGNMLNKFFEAILPKNLTDSYAGMISSMNGLSNYYNRVVSGKDPLLNRATVRDSLNSATNGGRCDNVYNIDLNRVIGTQHVIDTYNQDKSDNDKIGYPIPTLLTSQKRQVYSIGRPSNIDIEIIPEMYQTLDYNKLPDSIKNLKDNKGLSLNDKKKITIPWEVNYKQIDTDLYGGIYELKCNKAYYTGHSNIDERANILLDYPSTDLPNFDKCTINSINTLKYSGKYNFDMLTGISSDTSII